MAAQSTLDDMDELVVQFGYVTLFVTAFPLTPLCALLSNVLESRIGELFARFVRR